jgi:hypothetical protein
MYRASILVSFSGETEEQGTWREGGFEWEHGRAEHNIWTSSRIYI